MIAFFAAEEPSQTNPVERKFKVTLYITKILRPDPKLLRVLPRLPQSFSGWFRQRRVPDSFSGPPPSILSTSKRNRGPPPHPQPPLLQFPQPSPAPIFETPADPTASRLKAGPAVAFGAHQFPQPSPAPIFETPADPTASRLKAGPAVAFGAHQALGGAEPLRHQGGAGAAGQQGACGRSRG